MSDSVSDIVEPVLVRPDPKVLNRWSFSRGGKVEFVAEAMTKSEARGILKKHLKVETLPKEFVIRPA